MTSKMHQHSRRALLIAAPATLVLAGCGSLIGPANAPPQIYMLEPQFGPVDAPMVNWQLSVTRPDAADVYDTERLVIERAQILDYYANAQWTDQTELLLQRLVVEAFEKSGRIKAVARDREGLRADVMLQIEVRNFLARYDSENGAPTVLVELVAKLVTPQRLVIATLDARYEAAAGANSIPAAVAAFNSATGAAIEEIVAWTLRTGGASAPADSSTPPAHHRRR
jgi:cholesterol transport system auxiliary component